MKVSSSSSVGDVNQERRNDRLRVEDELQEDVSRVASAVETAISALERGQRFKGVDYDRTQATLHGGLGDVARAVIEAETKFETALEHGDRVFSLVSNVGRGRGFSAEERALLAKQQNFLSEICRTIERIRKEDEESQTCDAARETQFLHL